MSTLNYLFRRGAIYYYRARIPVELVKFFGRTEIKKSLDTADPAEARRRCAYFSRRTKELFQMAEGLKHLNQYAGEQLLRNWYQDMCKMFDFDRKHKLAPEPENLLAMQEQYAKPRPEGLDDTGDYDIGENMISQDVIQNSYDIQDFREIETLSGDLLRDEKINFVPESEEFEMFVMAVASTMDNLLQRESLTGRQRYEFAPDKAFLLPKKYRQDVDNFNEDDALLLLRDLWLRHYLADANNEKEAQQYIDGQAQKGGGKKSLHLAEFDRIIQKPVVELINRDLRKYLETITKLPTNHARSGVKEADPLLAIQKNQALKVPFPTIQKNTLAERVSAVKTVLNWALRKGLCSSKLNIEGILGGVKRTQGTNLETGEKQREAFSMKQLSIIFSAPQYTGGNAPVFNGLMK